MNKWIWWGLSLEGESCSDEVATISMKSIKSFETLGLKGPSIFDWKSWDWIYSIGERFSSCGAFSIICGSGSIIYLFPVSVIKLLKLLISISLL